MEEVEETKKPRELKRDNKVVAVISPVLENEKNASHATAAYKKSLAAIGSWSDLDADELVKNIAQWRNDGSRPPTRP